MANTYCALHYHIVFSTKNRVPWIAPDIESRVWAYLGGITRENGTIALGVGGVEDHIHMLVGIPPTIAVSKAVQRLKSGSSQWIHETFPDLRDFTWQDGYGAFTVGQSQIPDTLTYIAGQREHHRVKTFREEYFAFLKKHAIEFEERYALD